MNASPLLSIIIVNWNTRELLARCLESVLRDRHQAQPSHTAAGETAAGNVESAPGPVPPLTLEAIVVDNGSSDGSVEMVRDLFPEAVLIANHDNLGFTRANNQALERARGRYLLLLNSDTEVLPGALRSMVQAMGAHPEVGILGPQLLNTDGTVQSSRRRFPTLATAFLESTVLQRYVPDHPVLRHYYVLDQPDDVPQEVDWLVGACLMVRREALETVGGMDERFFMYSEELDWCRRARQAGWRVLYWPYARVIHHQGKSSDRDPLGRHLYFQESKCRYFAKHHGRAAGLAVRTFLCANYGFQMIEEGAKLLLGHKPDLRRYRLGLYWSVLKGLAVGSRGG